MSDLSSNPAQLESLLSQLSVNDTNTIKRAEASLKPFLKKPSCLPALLTQLQGSASEQVRHMATVLIKKKITSLFSKCSKADQTNLKNTFISMLVNEPSKAVRIGIASVISLLAKSVLTTDGDWPELFALLTQLVGHAEEGYRSLCFDLLNQLIENVVKYLVPHTPTLVTMFMSGFQDHNTAVSTAAMGAAANYVSCIADEQEVMQIGVLINPMIAVMTRTLSQGEDGDDDVVVKGLEVLQECMTNDQPLINEHIATVVPFLMAILSGTAVSQGVKEAAGQTAICLIQFRPKFLAKCDMVKPMLMSLVQIIALSDASGAGSLFVMDRAEKVEEGGEEEDMSDDKLNQQLAQTLLDAMAIHVPSKFFTENAMSICSTCLASASPKERKAGCAVMGIIVEGCKDAFKELMGSILAGLLPAVRDSDVSTRECAWFAIGQLTEHCQSNIATHHQTLMPVILGGLEDPQETVVLSTCYVVENFVDALQASTLVGYMPHLMSRLVHILQSSTNKNLQELALSAIASLAVSSDAQFLPYVEMTCTMLSQILFITEPALFQLRGRALECLGHVAVAIGKDHFTPYFELGMRSAMQGLQVEDSALKEHSFIYFANAVKVMGHTFDGHLKEMVPFLAGVICEPELSPFEDAETKLAELGADEDEDDDDGGGKFLLNTQDGFVDTKKAALTALGALAEHTKGAFYPYLESTLNDVLLSEDGALNSYHQAIRSEATVILEYMVGVACDHTNFPRPPKHQSVVLDPIVTEMVRAVMLTYVTALDDMEKEPVAAALIGICGVLEMVGVAALGVTNPVDNTQLGQTLVKKLHDVLKEKLPCQKIEKHETHHTGEDDDDDDHDNVVMDAATDTIAYMAKAAGSAFEGYYQTLHKPLMKFTKSNRAFTDRAMALGCVAEVLQEFDSASASKYVDSVLPVIAEALQDRMEEVRRNGTYCLGVVCSSVGAPLTVHYSRFLQILQPLCVRPAAQLVAGDVGGADVDNALSAVAKMIVVAADAVPLAQVLPAMVAALPLRADLTEAASVYGCFIQLIMTGNAIAMSMLPQLLVCLCQVIAPASLYEDGAKALVVTFFKQMAANPSHQSALTAALPLIADGEVSGLIDAAIRS